MDLAEVEPVEAEPESEDRILASATPVGKARRLGRAGSQSIRQ